MCRKQPGFSPHASHRLGKGIQMDFLDYDELVAQYYVVLLLTGVRSVVCEQLSAGTRASLAALERRIFHLAVQILFDGAQAKHHVGELRDLEGNVESAIRSEAGLDSAFFVDSARQLSERLAAACDRAAAERPERTDWGDREGVIPIYLSHIARDPLAMSVARVLMPDLADVIEDLNEGRGREGWGD